MDDVFGASQGLAIADQRRQEAIFQRLGLIKDAHGGSFDERSDEEVKREK